MASRIVTVFGGSGFLGRHTVRALAKDGWRVRVAARQPELAEFLRTSGMVGQVQLFQADVTNEASVRRAIGNADAVVNLVGIMHGGFSGRRLTDINTDGARLVARVARSVGVQHFVHVSALGVSEASESLYAKSKAAGEAAVREAFPEAVILRPSVMFGQEDELYNRFANMARFLPAVPVVGAETRFQPVFVGNVAQAIKAVVKGKGETGATYELGGPAVQTFKEIVQHILRMVGRNRAILPLPFGLARILSFPLSLVPGKPLTPDQVELLKSDSIVSSGAKGFAELGIQPDGVDAIVPSYIWRFRKTGQFTVVEN